MNNEEVISRELYKVNGLRKIGKVFISCPLGTHGDSSPSFGINAVANGKYAIGSWYCFGCGKAGGWNQLAKRLGLVQVDENKKDTHAKRHLHHAVYDIYNDLDEVIKRSWDRATPVRKFPEEIWRTIPTELLESLGCQCVFDPQTRDYAVIMPVWVGGELVGAVKADWVKSADPNKAAYITSPGNWVKETGLLGYDELERNKPFVVVEGPRDKWRLTRDGIPAVAILGALQWTRAKANLLAARNPPRVLVFTDGDAAGQAALDLVYGSLVETGLTVKFVNAVRLTELAREAARETGDPKWEKVKIDPANCDENTIQKVRQFCAG